VTLQLGSHGPLVSRWTDVMLRRFKSYATGMDGLPIRNDGYFGLDEQKVQWEYERRTHQAVDGVVSDRDLGALGLALPVIFTLEGHKSNMWLGPCADGARRLQQEGVCYWQPVWYDWDSLPFNNESGVQSLAHLMTSDQLPDKTPFPPGTPWGIWSFSQGAMVACDFMEQQILSGPLNWRLKDFKRGLALGNPRRERNRNAPWVSRPAKRNTSGIMVHDQFVTTGTSIAARWQESAHTGDMFAENTDDAAGWDKEAIAKIITENSWFGSDAAIFSRLVKLYGNPVSEAIPALMALISAVKFAVSNPNPHYTTITDPGDVDWMRGVAA
jgi:hypothetical protein